MIVKFANLCDRCGKRSSEYQLWPSCRHCGLDICDECLNKDTLEADEFDFHCTCKECEKNPLVVKGGSG